MAETCVWQPYYMFGTQEGYIMSCIDNPHHNRINYKSNRCPSCGRKVEIKE